MDNIKVDKELDCLGLYCPVPIMKTAQMIKNMNSGEVLEITADDIGVLKDIPAWAKTTGNEFLGSKSEGDVHKVYVRKKNK
ncbi:MAG: SirA family protein [Candidatus Firestonebacteria bacterium RIFOXYC2_FULL_39_67]|nr:MAG: SirA family protein [Candidatus Firestonebacteria bacterium RIFOXYD2_FULL_39_29]OGF52592.1 MAG: SirA family protein [Candidatus Firestonebacteria bacterium RifOxyC12_full_39_7]OGF53338.1 MAG: SirA family protein [Candidatus Firestonebacteria bacterium RIFOXYC2_FULL_39_67]